MSKSLKLIKLLNQLNQSYIQLSNSEFLIQPKTSPLSELLPQQKIIYTQNYPLLYINTNTFQFKYYHQLNYINKHQHLI